MEFLRKPQRLEHGEPTKVACMLPLKEGRVRHDTTHGSHGALWPSRGSLVEKCSPRVLGQNLYRFYDVFHIVDFQNDPQSKSGNLPRKSLLKVH